MFAIHLQNKGLKYVQIYEQIKGKILNKEITEGYKLPSKRILGQELDISVHTVKEAYEQLEAEGYILSKERSGYYVGPFNFDWHEPQVEIIFEEEPKRRFPYDFHNGHIDKEVFPYRDWREAGKVAFKKELLWNGETCGEYVLREQIAKYVARSRGFQCNPDQVFVFSGTSQQLEMICELLDIQNAAIENPAFLSARNVIQRYAKKIESIPLDAQGVQVPTSRATFLYTTPAHQFPIGMVMTLERRLELLNWARQTNSYIFEDDYDSEYRYKGQPIPSLAQLDQLQHVIYSGTFSKTLIPSIRVSYVILPRTLAQKMERLLEEHKTTVSRVEQHTIAEFMQNGSYDKHVNKMRTLYRKKHAILLQQLNSKLADGYEIIGDYAGLHIVLQLPITMNEKVFIERCRMLDVVVYPTASNYENEQSNNQVIIGFGGLSEQQLIEGIQLLLKVAT